MIFRVFPNPVMEKQAVQRVAPLPERMSRCTLLCWRGGLQLDRGLFALPVISSIGRQSTAVREKEAWISASALSR